jgi:hypothetical protein
LSHFGPYDFSILSSHSGLLPITFGVSVNGSFVRNFARVSYQDAIDSK